jgi:hypothetical protein
MHTTATPFAFFVAHSRGLQRHKSLGTIKRYYKCANPDCKAKKHEVSDCDNKILEVTYLVSGGDTLGRAVCVMGILSASLPTSSVYPGYTQSDVPAKM